MDVNLEGMYGLGDNIYQRGMIKQVLARGDVRLALQTSWPELYADLPMQVVRAETRLRTQLKNVRRQSEAIWSPWIAGGIRGRLRYGPREMQRWKSLPAALAASFPVTVRPTLPVKLDLPSFNHISIPTVVHRDPYAIVRPVTRRREWNAVARSPDPRYIRKAVELMRSMGLYVISVADIDPPHEVLIDDTDADLKLHKGELSVLQLLTLHQRADVIVGGVGFIVPLAMAADTPAIIIGGGLGLHNAPHVITNGIDSDVCHFILPDHYCMCGNMTHDCPKHITSFEERFSHSLDMICSRRMST